MSNVVKFPFARARGAWSRMPRRSKNGTPEERAAKSAGAPARASDSAGISMRKAEVKEPPKIAQSRAVQAVLETLDERELKAAKRVMAALDRTRPG
jgi:hypothetical protein